MATCDHCGHPIEGPEVLVPKWPKRAFRFHSDRHECVLAANRRARLMFSQISGRRGSRVQFTGA